MTQPLHLADFPLHGVKLIESSAGTGKTYTIANLYLRLVLERELEVPQILVVTFTNAATEELRSRIRRRLREARALISGDGTVRDTDLSELLQRIEKPASVAWRLLDDALTRMDEAAIFTIHGFAQRMLAEHAFESGVPFEAELLGDERLLRRAAVEDFWRRRFYNATADKIAWAVTEWGTPDGLYRQIAVLLGKDSVRLLPEAIPERLRALEVRWRQLRARLVEVWINEGDAACALLRDSPALNRTSYHSTAVECAIASFQAWQSGMSLGDLPDRMDLFTPAKLASATKKGYDTPTGLLFDLCAEIQVLGPSLKRTRRAALLAEAVDFVHRTVTEHKSARRLLAYDDLLIQLDRVLASEESSGLAMQIGARYPVAMVDEFQDTDPLQYRIFSAIYASEKQYEDRWPIKADRVDKALFLIGDPKQAIYGFRGADIFAYLQAKREAGNSTYTLDTNWRSRSALVEAINRLFATSSQPFLLKAIEFHPVKPSPEANLEQLTIENTTPTPLACWWLPRTGKKLLSTRDAKQQAASACAYEIARLLMLSAQGAASLGQRPLVARDFAILVRDYREADIVRTALDEAGIASVFLSRESVFATLEAMSLRLLLRAVIDPGDAQVLRTALATDLIGADAAELESFNHEEEVWETWLAHFHVANRRWREKGFMAMFTQLLSDCAIAHRLLADQGGERRMTNLLQLGELLMIADKEHSGFEALMRWLDMRIDEPNGDNEAEQIRLESEESLVQVVTIHASKGLEYSLVFMPFPWSARPLDPSKIAAGAAPFLFHAEDDFSLCADLGTDSRESHARHAEDERLAEDLRLLYVALTRARQRIYLTWGAVAGAGRSALAWLLHGENDMGGMDDEGIRARLMLLNGSNEILTLKSLPCMPTCVPALPAPEGQRAPHFTGHINASWRVTSYSGFMAYHSGRAELPDFDPQVSEGFKQPSGPESVGPDVFSFPRGTRTGMFFHALLEKLDFPQAHGVALTTAVAAGLRFHGFGAKWQGTIESLIQCVLDTPLDNSGYCLRNISRADRCDEWAFYYPLASFDSSALNALLRHYSVFEPDGEGLSFNALRGMMRGFVDLVFRREGRYYLVDYKSNYLGACSEDYVPKRLAVAMREHRYDLQYLIYCVALHRHLKLRLPDYDYVRDFGGIYYLFLRGMKPDLGQQAGIWYVRPDISLIESLDSLFSGKRNAI